MIHYNDYVIELVEEEIVRKWKYNDGKSITPNTKTC